MLALYLALYSLGRFFVEGLRVDPAHEIGPFRLNQVVAAVVFALSLAALARLRRQRAQPAAEQRLGRAQLLVDRASGPSAAGRGGTITRTVQPPPFVSSNVIVPPTPQARSRIASTPRCMPPRISSSSLAPRPSSAIISSMPPFSSVRAVTSTRVPPACLTAFVVASWAMR